MNLNGPGGSGRRRVLDVVDVDVDVLSLGLGLTRLGRHCVGLNRSLGLGELGNSLAELIIGENDENSPDRTSELWVDATNDRLDLSMREVGWEVLNGFHIVKDLDTTIRCRGGGGDLDQRTRIIADHLNLGAWVGVLVPGCEKLENTDSCLGLLSDPNLDVDLLESWRALILTTQLE